jgi:hypothetical protein
MEFINTVNTLQAGPQDILISFDVMSLFIMVTTGKALHLLSTHFHEATLGLLYHVRL